MKRHCAGGRRIDGIESVHVEGVVSGGRRPPLTFARAPRESRDSLSRLTSGCVRRVFAVAHDPALGLDIGENCRVRQVAYD